MLLPAELIGIKAAQLRLKEITMQSQESMFEKPEPTPVHPINTDLREQRQQQDTPPAEGDGDAYKEYAEGYSGEGYSESYNGPYGEPWLMEGEKLRPRQRPTTRRRNALRPLAVLLLIVALVIGWSGLSHARFNGGQRGWSGHSHAHFDGRQRAISAQSFFVASAPTLVVKGSSGDVHIHTGDTGNVIVANSNGMQVETEQNGDTIDVSTDSTSDSLLDSEQNLDITVPATSNVEIYNSSGNIQIEGVNGQVTLSTDSGNIELQNTLLRGNSSFKSNDGDITVQGGIDAQGNYQFQTNSGDVNLTLPEGSSFHLIPSTDSGSVENGFEGTQGNSASGPQLKISTDSGDITVQSQGD